MTATALRPLTQAEQGQPGLLAEIDRMRALLQARLDGDTTASTSGLRTAGALDDLAGRLGLTVFERDLLMLLAAVQLDSEVAELVTRIHGDARPTFALAMTLLSASSHWDALTPDRPLRSRRLVELGAGTTLATRPLTIDEHVLHTVTGLNAESRLGGLIDAAPLDAVPLTPSQERLADETVAAIDAIPGPLLVCLVGVDRGAYAPVAARLAAGLGRRALLVRDALLDQVDLGLTATLLDREAVLADRLLVTGHDGLLSLLESPVVVALGERGVGSSAATTRTCLTRTVDLPEPSEGMALWMEAARDAPEPVVRDLAQHYRLPARTVSAIAGEWRALGGDGAVLRRLTRERARVDLSPLAERIEPRATWDDLVLPDGQRQLVADLAAQVRHRAQVYDAWGFGRQSSQGSGITALFAGESGTGKTMAAEVVAGELGHELYRIDLSAVVSKYIGETEKNLRSVFDAAESSGAVLLFDEADALFGRRSDVKDSHDRYANLEVAYLLQRMESYRGLAILTTNLHSHVDRAFLRRLRFVVQFPAPDQAARAEIWRRSFPPEAPLEGVDPVALARLQVSGGSIRAIALSAAFSAADAGGAIRPEHVLRAAQVEYAKVERHLTDAEAAALRGSAGPNR